MKIKFRTSIYSDLHGTELGGRPSRGGHYRYSLLSLLKMSDADFLCYTSDREIDDLIKFFYEDNNISSDKLKFEIFEISNTKFKDLISQNKNVEEVKRSDRCVEIQYSKFHWWWKEDRSYDYYYWIDAGLSHCGLIPDKYRDGKFGATRGYYESNLFNNIFLKGLVEDTKDKFILLGKENDRNYWSGTVDPKWYMNYDRSIHIIGGLFGGHRDKWDNVVNIFEKYLENLLTTEKTTYHEEVIMSLMYFNHKELFELKHFDIWWFKGNSPSGVSDEVLETNKSFYKILEEINRIYE
jgi:hypothetical protein